MEFDPIYVTIAPYLQVVVSAIITALLGWAAAQFHAWSGIQIEAKHREALQSALINGAMRALGSRLEGKELPVRSELMAMAIHYVHKSVPDALAYFNVTPESLELLLEAKFGEIGLQKFELEGRLEGESF